MKPNQPLQGKKEVKAWAVVDTSSGELHYEWDEGTPIYATYSEEDKEIADAYAKSFSLAKVVPCTITYEI